MITILETWRVQDRWWTDEPIDNSYVEVIWSGRIFIFKQTLLDKVWRIVSADGAAKTASRGCAKTS